MRYNIHGGHAKVGCGAVGAASILNESVEDRKIKDIVIKYLREAGHTVFDCTEDYGSQSEVLSSIVRKCNANAVDLDVSIHFNAGANRPYQDGVTTGTEVYVYNFESTKAYNAANRIAKAIAKFGFKNRGVKCRRDLYYLANTKAQALLIEVCFVDDGDDAAIYLSNIEKIGKAIAEAIMDSKVVEPAKIETVKDGVYRFYDGKTGRHFHTANVAERDNCVKDGWSYEGVPWKKSSKGDKVYRLSAEEQMLTISKAERDSLKKSKWRDEGVAFHSPTSGKRVKVYRLYDGKYHLFTPNQIEISNLTAMNWKNEGLAFYGVK